MGFLDDYEPVEDRLRAFWSESPDGRILTELVKAEAGEFIVKALVWRSATLIEGELGKVLRTDLPDATGLAHERETDRGVNATSALENCETSAIGRALANLGYAAKGKRPSREEMTKSAPAMEASADAGGRVDHSSSASRASSEGTTGTEGEAVADPSGPSSEPGEAPFSPPSGQGTKPSLGSDHPGPPHYPLRPAECDHKSERTGHLLRPRKSPRGPVCPRCGLSYITVTESTAADLGAA